MADATAATDTPPLAQGAPGSPPAATLGADLLRLGGLGALCLGFALALNQLRASPLPLIYASKAVRMEAAVDRVTRGEAPAATKPPASTAETSAAQVIELPEFQNLVAGKQGVVLDARPELFHQLGHVPGALSLPREDFERGYAARRALLEAKRDQPIAVYCSGADCEDSQMVADALVKLGYRHVLIYQGGWEEWTQAGGEEEK